MDRRRFLAGAASAGLLAGAPRMASASDTERGDWYLYDGPSGTTHRYYHLGSQWRWDHPGGDWRDASGTAQGGKPYARFASPNRGAERQEWVFDVTQLAQEVAERARQPLEFLLRSDVPRTVASRLHAEAAPPTVAVTYATGRTEQLRCRASVSLDTSSVLVQGRKPELSVGGNINLALGFAWPREPVRQAVLRLASTRQWSRDTTVEVFRLVQPAVPEDVTLGLAQGYPSDLGIERDPAVLFFLDCDQPLSAAFFDAEPDWDTASHFDWSGRRRSLYPTAIGNRFALSKDALRPALVGPGSSRYGYRPLTAKSPKALLWSGAPGREEVTNAFYFFRPTATGRQNEPMDPSGRLPQEMYLRWYQLLGDGFALPDGETRRNGGKWGPGFAHLGRAAGWGSRFAHSPPDQAGRKGWSGRGQFYIGVDPEDPAYRQLLFGSYQYNAETSQTGEMFGRLGVLEPGRWYCCELYQRMNGFDPTGATQARKDGVLRAWIDGRLAFERTDMQWRRNPPWVADSRVVADQGILGVWWNTFWGGQYGGAPVANHHFVKNLVIATRYIGPMRLA